MNTNRFVITALAAAIAGALTANAAIADDDQETRRGIFKFEPIEASANSADWDPAAPWVVPKGYAQRIVSDETDLNIYDGGRDDWHDMNTVNETGKAAGRYMYRTHELRYPANQPEGGAVSVVDLKTGETKVLAIDPTYNALDGIRWTPWGTVLFAEEVDGGRLLEIVLDPNDPTVATEVIDRPAVGRIAHEGIDVGPDGAIYVVDEHRGQSSGCPGFDGPCGGGVYKFVPDFPGDLSSGSLYALKVTGPDGVGQGEWVGPIDASNARVSGSEFGGTSYQRPEDVEIIGGKLYVAVTEGPRAEGDGSEVYEGRVIAIDLETTMVTNFVVPGVNVPVELGRPGQEGFQTGFDSVDNLAESPDGRLVMVEDNGPSDIWFASPRTNAFGTSRKVELFASLTDPGAEGTGIYFSPFQPDVLYVNVQHSAADDGDATWAIYRDRGYNKHDRKNWSQWNKRHDDRYGDDDWDDRDDY